MSSVVEQTVDPALVRIAIDTARRRGQDVAEVPLVVLAEAAGVSRSTLVRRLRGSRRALDEAVRASGVDPGGRAPVWQRAVEAAARLIAERGLAALTLEAVAVDAGCSVHSVYTAFGGRDGLLGAVYTNWTPLRDIEAVLTRSPAQSAGEFRATVGEVYRVFAAGLVREPRVETAVLADAFARPDGPAARLVRRYWPWARGVLGGWLTTEVAAGRVRRLPMELLLQQLLGPILLHVLCGGLLSDTAGPDAGDLDQVCAHLAEAFVRAVAPPGADPIPALTAGTRPPHDSHDSQEGQR